MANPQAALTRYGSAISSPFRVISERERERDSTDSVRSLEASSYHRKGIHSSTFHSRSGSTDCRWASSFLDIRSNNPIPNGRRSVKLWALTWHHRLFFKKGVSRSGYGERNDQSPEADSSDTSDILRRNIKRKIKKFVLF